jgi:hypothetical protein
MNENRKVPFRMAKNLVDFQKAMNTQLRNSLREIRNAIVPSENVFTYSHGTKWRTDHSASPEAINDEEMIVHSSEGELPFERIVNNDLYAIVEVERQLVASLDSQFKRSMYQMINETTEQTGNVIRTDGPFDPEHFIQMLEKIEFGVDRNGEVSLPEIHAGPEIAQKMFDALSSQGPEFGERVNEIKRRKGEEALRKEADRKSKFPRQKGGD